MADIESFETLPFFRGISTKIAHPVVEFTRRDRRPRDLPLAVHEAADDWFLRRFGVRFRSQAVFVTSLHVVAAGYGPQTVRVLPLGRYQYCWSRATSDLLSILKGAAAAEVPGLLDAASYLDTDLVGAHRHGHELMLYCEQYVAIPVDDSAAASSPPSGSGAGLIIV